MTEREAFNIVGNIPIPTDDENYDIFQYQEAKAIALDALEKQIPKKPNKCFGFATSVFICPTCGRKQPIMYEQYYCKECGQKLDWSDTD